MIDLYMKELNLYFKKIEAKDKKANKSLAKDVEVFKKKYNSNFENFWKDYNGKSRSFRRVLCMFM